GRPLGEGARPAIVQQHARFLVSTVRENLVSALPDRAALSKPEQTERVGAILQELGLPELAERLREEVMDLPLVEQRRLAIARAASTDAKLLLVDEPTAGLDESGREAVVALLRRVARDRALLVVTHDQRVARGLGGDIALLAGGRVFERQPAAQFLAAPHTEHGQQFVRTGRVSLPSLNARPEELADDEPRPTPLPPATRRLIDSSRGPRDFYWALPGTLGGCPRPGIVRDLDHDLEALQRLGVGVVVTLEEERTVDPEALARFGMRGHHLPIVDMRTPSFEAMEALCRRFVTWRSAGEVVAVHCLAGLGRTGTVLAAALIWEGASVVEAVDRIRSFRPRSIQSDEQSAFLIQFAERLRRQTLAPGLREPALR
ncbi:MAG TPA: ATP-binding cassette domain-containing protein, partial [Polyangiaceae bacterium LLY-WYZ-15_(1-7)]|nr:ATP-binding cassette domain-containing protein [Polyangiaceae bacterium LLY-WYZ-15_(1-7)]